MEERLLSEAPKNLKICVEQERSNHPAPPQDVTSQVTDLQQMVNMLQAERDSLVAELQSGRMRRVEKLHPPQSQKKQPRTSENDQQEAKHVHQRKSQIPSRSWPTSSCEILWRSDRTGDGGTTDSRCFGNASVLNAFRSTQSNMVTFSVKYKFIKNHFHQKPLSSKTTFINGQFHEIRN